MVTSAGHFYELADMADRTRRVFRSARELADHVKENPLSMFMRVFKIPMKLATDGTAQQGVLNVSVRAGNRFEVTIEEVLTDAGR